MTSADGTDRAVLAIYREYGWWRDETLVDDINRYAVTQPDAPAFGTKTDRVTWKQYSEASDRLAGVLVAAGYQPGERVAVQLPDTAAVLVALVACEKAGLITTAVRRGRVVADEIPALREAAPSLRHHVVFPDDLEVGRVAVDGEVVTPAPACEWRERKLGPDDLWLVNSRSGTTGLPKCVLYYQNRCYYFPVAAEQVGELRADDVVMAVVPDPFGFGQWTSHFTPTLLGAPTVVIKRFNASKALELIEREKVTVLCAVSTQFVLMLNAPDLAKYDLTSLRIVFTGGELIPYERARDFERRTGAIVLNFYGLNESGFAASTTVHDATEPRLRIAGRVQPGNELRAVRRRGQRRHRHRPRPARLTRSGDLVRLSRGRPVNVQLFTPDGFVLHAHEVTVDLDGYLAVVGCKSDIIIRGGKNISATHVEDEGGAHAKIALVGAVPSPDPTFGERVAVRRTGRRSHARARRARRVPDGARRLIGVPAGAAGGHAGAAQVVGRQAGEGRSARRRGAAIWERTRASS